MLRAPPTGAARAVSPEVKGQVHIGTRLKLSSVCRQQSPIAGSCELLVTFSHHVTFSCQLLVLFLLWTTLPTHPASGLMLLTDKATTSSTGDSARLRGY